MENREWRTKKMIQYKRRKLPNGDIKETDFKEFFRVSREEYSNQYRETWEKNFPEGKFYTDWWQTYSFKKYIPKLIPRDEAELLFAYGSKEMSMPLCTNVNENMLTTTAERFDSWMDPKTGNTIWRTLNYWGDLSKIMVMDFGCGSGIYGISMYMNGASVVLCDVKSAYSDFIKWLIKKYELKDLKWLESSAENDFGDCVFDFIFASECLEHVFEPVVYAEKIFKALKKEGVAFLCPFFGSNEFNPLHLRSNDIRYGQDQTWFRELERIGYKLGVTVAQKLCFDEDIQKDVYLNKRTWVK
jgi:2-polyprenyl-3-methyl-5-hydroxy-6-metoxy-1,4-benzoquinol methylase